MSLDFSILGRFHNNSLSEVQSWFEKERPSWSGLHIFSCVPSENHFMGKLIEQRYGFHPNFEVSLPVDKFAETDEHSTGTVSLFRLFNQLGSAFTGDAVLLFQNETPFLHLAGHQITINSEQYTSDSLPAQQIKLKKRFQPMEILE